MTVLEYLATFFLTLALAMFGIVTLHGLSRWADPQSGDTKWGRIPTSSVATCERQDALRRAS